MPIKLKTFDTVDYFHVCGMHMKRFTAGVKGNVKIDYHFPHGVMVHRDGKQSEFIPIHNIRTVTPEDPEELKALIGGDTAAPKKRGRPRKKPLEAVEAAPN